MTAEDIVGCVARMETASRHARSWTEPGGVCCLGPRAYGYCQNPNCQAGAIEYSGEWATKAAHEANILLRLTGEDLDDGPTVHDWFELTYADYLALPRSILQSMPEAWQRRFVGLMNQLDARFDWRRNGCWVKFRDRRGRWMPDALADYERGRRILTPAQVKTITERHRRAFEVRP
jgi:hypothetical protein